MTADEIRELERTKFGYNDGTKTAVFEIAAQLAELNANFRAIHPELSMPQECKDRKCSYYQHYLAYGPAELTHEGFHVAEENGENHFKNCSRADSRKPCQVCEGYEKRLRS